MNYGIYSVLKKLVDGSELSSYDQYILEKACRKHEEELERRHAISAEKAEKIKGLILLVLNHANKALTPTDMQFDIIGQSTKKFLVRLSHGMLFSLPILIKNLTVFTKETELITPLKKKIGLDRQALL